MVVKQPVEDAAWDLIPSIKEYILFCILMVIPYRQTNQYETLFRVKHDQPNALEQ